MVQKRDLLSKIESRWALAKELGALPVIGGVVGGAGAYFTSFMSAWAPFSWIVGALIGAILVQVWSLARAAQGEREERRRRISMLEPPKGHVRPLQQRFEGERIYVSDLMPPLGYTIVGKEFRDCEIIGPANIHFSSTRTHGTSLLECGFINCDGVITKNSVTVNNVAVFQDCTFKDCRFYKATILVTAVEHTVYRGVLPGMNWLNDRPENGDA